MMKRKAGLSEQDISKLKELASETQRLGEELQRIASWYACSKLSEFLIGPGLRFIKEVKKEGIDPLLCFDPEEWESTDPSFESLVLEVEEVLSAGDVDEFEKALVNYLMALETTINMFAEARSDLFLVEDTLEELALRSYYLKDWITVNKEVSFAGSREYEITFNIPTENRVLAWLNNVVLTVREIEGRYTVTDVIIRSIPIPEYDYPKEIAELLKQKLNTTYNQLLETIMDNVV